MYAQTNVLGLRIGKHKKQHYGQAAFERSVMNYWGKG